MAARVNGKKMPARVVGDEDCRLRFERAAAAGVAKDSGMACLRLPPAEGKGYRTSRVWEAPAAVPAIEAVAGELKAAGAEMVSMEPAPGYRRIWFAVPEAAGLPVQLAGSSQAKNPAGRPKPGKEDARRVARLTETGMLRPSFVPPPEIRALQVLTRDRPDLARERTRWRQRPEKLPEDAFCKLPGVASKLAGSDSARAVTEAVIAGGRGPRVPADMARTRMRAKIPQLEEAFTGMRFGDRHAEQAGTYLRMTGGIDAGIRDLDARIAARIARVPAAWGTGAGGTTGPGAGHGPDAAVLPAAGRLAEIPGLSREQAVSLIAGTGPDVSRFPAAGHLVPRAGPAPVASRSGKRKGKGKKGHGGTYAKTICRAAASAAARTGTFPGARHRRLASRPEAAGRGKPAAPPPGPSSSSPGTCWPTPPPAAPASGRTATPGTPTPAARPAAASASRRPSATTSSSPPARKPPEPARLTAYRPPGPAAAGPCRHARNRDHPGGAEVDYFWSEITDQMELARHGAHTFEGLLTRTAAVLAAHTLLLTEPSNNAI